MPGKRFLSSHMMKHSFHIGTLPRNNVRRMLIQHYDIILTSVKVCSHECLIERAISKNELIWKSRKLDKTGTVLQSVAHVYQIYLLCDIWSSHASLLYRWALFFANEHKIITPLYLFSSPGRCPGRAIVLPPGVGVGVGVSKKFNVKVFLCDGQGAVSRAILSPWQVLLENILVEGKARNKHRPVNWRKSSYNRQVLILYF